MRSRIPVKSSKAMTLCVAFALETMVLEMRWFTHVVATQRCRDELARNGQDLGHSSMILQQGAFLPTLTLRVQCGAPALLS